MADGRDQDPGSSTPEGDEPEVEATPDADDSATGEVDADEVDQPDDESEESRDEPDDIDLSEYEAEFTEDDAAHPDDDDRDAEGELVAVGAATKTPAKRAAAAKKGAEKKGKATPKRSLGAEPHRTGPVAFVKESVAELRKVVYPTGQQLLNYFVVVLIFVLFIIAVVSLLDLVFGWLIFKVFA